MAAGAAQAAFLHPQQHIYFNLLADRDAPQRLTTWYENDIWRVSHQRGLEQALAVHSDATVWTWRAQHGALLHGLERRRLVAGDAAAAADLVLSPRPRIERLAERRPWIGQRFAPAGPALRVYDNTLVAAAALNVSLLGETVREAWRAEYRAVAATPPLARSEWDLHLGPAGLMWLKAPCGEADAAGEFAFTAWPADGGAAASSACDFAGCGVRVDGTCMVYTPLPRGRSRPLTLASGYAAARTCGGWRSPRAQRALRRWTRRPRPRASESRGARSTSTLPVPR